MSSKLPETEPSKHKTAAFLANLQRTVGTKSAAVEEPKPAAPRIAAVEEEPDAPAPVPTSARKPVKKSTTKTTPAADNESVSMEIALNPGKGQRVVYIRVDKTLADRLALIAFQNKIQGGETGPTTVNEIGIEALTAWLDRQERRAA
ncbi:MAG: hypothetical protein AAF743_12315 [Planctomycetota bacterium]